MRTERESKENDTHKLIVEVAERLLRQISFQKTTVADIARDRHMSPANIYRFFMAKSDLAETPASRYRIPGAQCRLQSSGVIDLQACFPFHYSQLEAKRA
jgi:methylphosphotriester-DNA--protein-cysteine methyltransferase